MEDTSAVFLLDQMLSDALKQECTDIHIHSTPDNLAVQFRIQGRLVPYLQSEQNPRAMVRRIKALAKMDIAEHRIPQNGAFQTKITNQTVSVRVATLPTATGESAVLRMLPQYRLHLSLLELGMLPQQEEAVRGLLQGTPGLILVAGPTGAGKTTTMYTLMRMVSERGDSVVSVEDPVEIPSNDFSQLEVREDKGISFATGLKALLRQDPDALMVGEIRDAQTAKIVLQAALTGHLVFSTTHATDFVGAFARLTEFGVPRAMLAEVFRGVIIQRLPNGAYAKRGPGTLLSQMTPAVFEVYPIGDDVYELLLSDLPWPRVRQKLRTILPAVSEVRTLRKGG
ncbi:GspE/PulE family protein [Alicyclobacillus sp. SO9]|uniref:GspE/PulE family protein n=1 Tax=Alicyclobacillus sp. SO9 TaxID=2665646 RepID=UPI0018E79C5B|nr:ATPase, T2SS/T4P/T4SS family [Alicyclobacillus sp. SO9]QQE76996.1 Flp pilus assembly complex ATPase component TadA [Alicyclobacillus sp. SO9]